MSAKKIILLVVGTFLFIGYFGYKALTGYNVSFRERASVKEFALEYLNDRYGNQNFKITDYRYEYEMETLFDYSNPVGYWVFFKSDQVKEAWIIVYGLNKEDYYVYSDYFLETYYFPNEDGHVVYDAKKVLMPRKKIEEMFLNDIKNEFDPNIEVVECNYIELAVPEGYGKIPTMDDLKTDINLYLPLSFTYRVKGVIDDVEEYEQRLKMFVQRKYKKYIDADHKKGLSVSVNPNRYYVDVRF
ncbi:MAG: hypothetical protein E7159_02565 [Firmicutes bacterium]|nr:hypothetical protein [Bacillota bacterium]